MKVEVEVRDGAVALHVTIVEHDNPHYLRRLVLTLLSEWGDTGLETTEDAYAAERVWRRLTQVIEGELTEAAVFVRDGADITFKRK